MTIWLFFAILAPLLWASTNVVDRVIRKRFVKNDLVLMWLSAISKLPIAILLFLISKSKMPNFSPLIFMLLAGILWTIPVFLYYKALEKEESSRVSVLIQSVPVFTLLIAFFAIQERLGINQFSGFLLILLGGISASIKNTEGGYKFSKAFWLVIIASLFWAASDVIFKKFEPEFGTFLNAFAFFLIGAFLPAFCILFTSKEKKFLSYFHNLPMRSWIYIIFSQSAGITGSLTFAYALTLGKASLTSVIMGVQPLCVLIIGLLLSKWLKEFYKEDVSKQALIFKGVAFMLIISGFICLYI